MPIDIKWTRINPGAIKEWQKLRSGNGRGSEVVDDGDRRTSRSRRQRNKESCSFKLVPSMVKIKDIPSLVPQI